MDTFSPQLSPETRVFNEAQTIVSNLGLDAERNAEYGHALEGLYEDLPKAHISGRLYSHCGLDNLQESSEVKAKLSYEHVEHTDAGIPFTWIDLEGETVNGHLHLGRLYQTGVDLYEAEKDTIRLLFRPDSEGFPAGDYLEIANVTRLDVSDEIIYAIKNGVEHAGDVNFRDLFGVLLGYSSVEDVKRFDLLRKNANVSLSDGVHGNTPEMTQTMTDIWKIQSDEILERIQHVETAGQLVAELMVYGDYLDRRFGISISKDTKDSGSAALGSIRIGSYRHEYDIEGVSRGHFKRSRDLLEPGEATLKNGRIKEGVGTIFLEALVKESETRQFSWESVYMGVTSPDRVYIDPERLGSSYGETFRHDEKEADFNDGQIRTFNRTKNLVRFMLSLMDEMRAEANS